MDEARLEHWPTNWCEMDFAHPQYCTRGVHRPGFRGRFYKNNSVCFPGPVRLEVEGGPGRKQCEHFNKHGIALGCPLARPHNVFHLFKTIFYFPLLVVKTNLSLLFFFSRGLKQMEDVLLLSVLSFISFGAVLGVSFRDVLRGRWVYKRTNSGLSALSAQPLGSLGVAKQTSTATTCVRCPFWLLWSKKMALVYLVV